MKTLSLGSCFVVLTLSAFSQVKTGTSVVIEYSPDRIILAADSLMVDSQSKTKDYCDCKLAALDKNVAFAAASILGEPGFWEATKEASMVYHAAVANHPSNLPAEISKLLLSGCFNSNHLVPLQST